MPRIFVVAAIFNAMLMASSGWAKEPARENERQDRESSSSEAIPIGAALSGLALVALTNRRRNLQKVLC